MNRPKTEMLDGILVIDFTNNLAGPATAALLAERGAEVIHIEMPGKGDDNRYFPPVLKGLNSTTHMWANRGKKSVTLNLKDPRALNVIYKMVEEADIVIESNRPGVMDKLGLGYDKLSEINERLIYCSVSAFGHVGPNRSKPGYDIIAQAYSGVMYFTGEPDGPPTKIGIALGDFVGAINAFGSVLGALYQREMTGYGQHVDVSLARGLLWLVGLFNQPVNGSIRYRTGNHDFSLCPYGVFNGKDGSCVIGAVNETTWKHLCETMGREDLIDDPEYKKNTDRVRNKTKVIELIENWLNTFEHIDEPVEMLDKAGVPVSKISNGDYMYQDKHALECGWIQEINVPDEVTEVDHLMGCVGLSEFSGALIDGTKAAHSLGADNYEVLTRYGMTREEIDECLKDWNKKK
ncbi:MAG: CoA transferase [Lachnospiraceae bacterium]|nr:CoA transferase [Lachnospiraceae bacterium]